MEFLKEMEEIVEPTSPAQTRANSRIHSRAHSRTHTGSASFANFSIPERQPLLARATAALQSQNQNQEQHALGHVDRDKPVAGGTVLGIHNLAIVFPQFAVSLITSLIFKIVDGSDQDKDTTYYGRNGVAWVLRFGGFCTLFGAIVARSLPLTKTEEEMQYILEELTTLNKEDTHP